MTSLDEIQADQIKWDSQRGKIIAVCGAKGGIGRTTIAVNLAVALSKKNVSVSILDGDFQFGDVNLAMDLKHSLTIKEVVDGLESLDEHSMSTYLTVHESGVKVLSAPERPEHADLITFEAVTRILDVLHTQHDYIVVDTPVGLQEQTLHFLEQADQILLVTNLEMTALKNTKLMLETLNILDLRQRVKIVINRANMESVIKAADAARILAVNEPIYIANDFQICSQAINLGVPFVMKNTKSEVAKGIFKMAEMISSENGISSKKVKKNHSPFSKLFSKKRS